MNYCCYMNQLQIAFLIILIANSFENIFFTESF